MVINIKNFLFVEKALNVFDFLKKVGERHPALG